jgi:hypothetical protein
LIKKSYLRLADITETAVTEIIISDPPIIVFTPGVSPTKRNTHIGLKTGSITAMRFADKADILLIPLI